MSTEIVEGFMGAKVPVTKLSDGAVEFWIPWWEWERVRNALDKAIEAYPNYMNVA